MALDSDLAQLCVLGIWKEWRTIDLRETWKNTVGDNLARKRGLDKIGYLKQTVEASMVDFRAAGGSCRITELVV